jgi:hypothetical protein
VPGGRSKLVVLLLVVAAGFGLRAAWGHTPPAEAQAPRRRTS